MTPRTRGARSALRDTSHPIAVQKGTCSPQPVLKACLLCASGAPGAQKAHLESW